jgi:hypothetical protein
MSQIMTKQQFTHDSPLALFLLSYFYYNVGHLSFAGRICLHFEILVFYLGEVRLGTVGYFRSGLGFLFMVYAGTLRSAKFCSLLEIKICDIPNA